VENCEAAVTYVVSVSLTFGAITCAAGLIGVALGSFSASKLRRFTPRADPFVCAFGMITSAPFLFLSLFLSSYNTAATWVGHSPRNNYLIKKLSSYNFYVTLPNAGQFQILSL